MLIDFLTLWLSQPTSQQWIPWFSLIWMWVEGSVRIVFSVSHPLLLISMEVCGPPEDPTWQIWQWYWWSSVLSWLCPGTPYISAQLRCWATVGWRSKRVNFVIVSRLYPLKIVVTYIYPSDLKLFPHCNGAWSCILSMRHGYWDSI
jgi:hypothetical protein